MPWSGTRMTSRSRHASEARTRSMKRPMQSSVKAKAFVMRSSKASKGTSNGSCELNVSHPARNGVPSAERWITSSANQSPTVRSS